MKVWRIKDAFALDNLRPDEETRPEPGHGQALVRLTAASLNFRDLVVARGGYGRGVRLPLVPLSDGAGVVEAVGAGVTRVKPGDRVAAMFFQGWISGEPTAEKFATSLGGPLDGVLAEYRVFDQEGLVVIPEYLSDEEAATLPCAALTAWSALAVESQVRPGEVVLVQGTGGVSLFALQFAKLMGAEVIVTSSSDAKLARAKALGADHLVNYREQPEWSKPVKDITGGRGCDHVVEVGGAGTLSQSVRAVRVGGHISLIGVLTGPSGGFDLPLALMRQVRLQGITVGSRQGFESMLRAMTLHGTRPVVDRIFPFAEARAAFDHLVAAGHFGKIVIRF